MSEAAGSNLLEIHDLHGGYGDIPVLRGVSLSVAENEVVGVLGRNGMGKSTLLKTVMGFLPATGGSVRFDREDVTRAAPYRRSRLGLGYVPQGRGIFQNLTVRDNLRFAWNADAGDGSADEGVQRILSDFPALERLLDRQGGALSGGEQQLLALARCLIADPVMVILDEPTEGIQPSIIEEIGETLARIRREQGLTLLLVEQNLDFLTDLCDRLLIIERGAVIGALSGGDMTSPAIIDEFVGLGGARHTRKTATTQPAANVTPFPTPARSAAAPATKPPKPAAASAARADAAGVPSALRSGYMAVRRPTLDQMREIVKGLRMHLGDDELLNYMRIMEGSFQLYDRIDSLPDVLPEVKYPRTPGHRPSSSENPLNAWYYKCDVRGAPAGPLKGKRIAIKDTICLAGVPMMNGASVLEGYVPDVDATVVTRMLDAGATIVGKSNCEYLCLSAGSHTNATGPVHNPYKMGYSAGGSSSGSGALVASGEVDMAIGGDQGGSVRIPSSHCGCYGMKPTHGLVPYSGVMPIEFTIDTLGPMTSNVEDNALLLEVIAGHDGLDPRQYAPKVDKYTAHLSRGVSGMRIAVITEGFGWPESEPDVDAKVRAAADRFKALGAQVDEVSLPIHRDGQAIWTPIALEGLVDFMMHGNGAGTNWRGLYVTSLIDFFANWRSRADELSPSLKVSMMVGQYFLKHYRGRYYGKSQNLSRKLRGAYDALLQRYDLLLMPTLPMKAQPMPPPDATLDLYIQRAFEVICNTTAFSCTGHPAMNVPCGLSEGLPIGMMLTGKYYDEGTIYRAAHAFEQIGDWRTF